jgi:hypothetical protein
MSVKGWQLDEEKFVGVLRKLIGEAKWLQNNPPDLVPCEDRGEGQRGVAVCHSPATASAAGLHLTTSNSSRVHPSHPPQQWQQTLELMPLIESGPLAYEQQRCQAHKNASHAPSPTPTHPPTPPLPSCSCPPCAGCAGAPQHLPGRPPQGAARHLCGGAGQHHRGVPGAAGGRHRQPGGGAPGG